MSDGSRCGHAVIQPADKCWACLRQERRQAPVVVAHDPELERLMLDLNKHEHEVMTPTNSQPVFGPGTHAYLRYQAAEKLAAARPSPYRSTAIPVGEWLKHLAKPVGVESCWDGANVTAAMPAPVDPLDVKYDGWTLRQLVEHNDKRRREEWALAHPYTANQKAALSAHWSAQLRAKVAATKAADAERERNRVTVDMEDD